MYKIIKNEGSAGHERFKRHLFQEIEVDKPFTETEKAQKETDFAPLDLEAKCSAPRASEIEPVEDDAEDESRLEDLQRAAFADGFVKGEQSGVETERMRLKSAFDAFHEAILNLEEIRDVLHLSAEREAVELALAIAGKVVSHEVSVNGGTILGVLKEALQKIPDQERIKIRMNKADLHLIDESGCRVSELISGVKEVAVEGDDTVSKGGCVIETGFGSIDARMESQLQAVEDLLRSEMP